MSRIVEHHLLEILLFPCKDGTMKEIRNSVARLKELNAYEKHKMTISMTRAEHASLHHTGAKHVGNFKAWNKGKKCPGVGGRKPGFVSEKKGKKLGHIQGCGPRKGCHWHLENGKRIYEVLQ